jgi:hypothetical protein
MAPPSSADSKLIHRSRRAILFPQAYLKPAPTGKYYASGFTKSSFYVSVHINCLVYQITCVLHAYVFLNYKTVSVYHQLHYAYLSLFSATGFTD